MKQKRLALLLMLMIATVFSCRSMAKDSKALHIYTALVPEEARIYTEAFTQDTKINVVMVRLSAGELLTRIRAEAKRPQSSVWFGGSAIEFIAAKNEGLLAPYKAPAALYLKENLNLRDKDWYWSGFYFGAIGFECYKPWFEKKKIPFPTSWQELLKPEFKGQIGTSYPYTSGTAFTILASLVTLMGEDQAYGYWKNLDANIAKYNTSGSAICTQVGLGEVPIGITFSHDILTKGVDAGYPVKLTFPKEGTGYEIGALAMIKGAPEVKNAKKFIDWVLSKRCQSLFIKWNRVPLHPEAEIGKEAVKASEIKLLNFDNQWLGENNKRLIEKWRKTIGK
jgi:iron(III) transport system substrate-binding protein